jgi:hypothetical protein
MNIIMQFLIRRRIQLALKKFARAHVAREDALGELYSLTRIEFTDDPQGRLMLREAVSKELEHHS